MALPHLQPFHTARKNVYETAIVSKRTREKDLRDRWSTNADYFNKQHNSTVKKNMWESPEYMETR